MSVWKKKTPLGLWVTSKEYSALRRILRTSILYVSQIYKKSLVLKDISVLVGVLDLNNCLLVMMTFIYFYKHYRKLDKKANALLFWMWQFSLERLYPLEENLIIQDYYKINYSWKYQVIWTKTVATIVNTSTFVQEYKWPYFLN